MKTKHILKMQCGVTVEAEVDISTGKFNCQWDPSPPFPARLLQEIKQEYFPWRNQIFEDLAKQTGQRIMIIDT